MIQVNGELLPAAATVQELLDRQGWRADRVAVEKNGEIVRRGDFSATALHDGDRLEIVRFVGGG